MKFDIGKAAQGLLAVTTGAQAGRLAGQQEQRQREQQDAQTALHLFQLQRGLQDDAETRRLQRLSTLGNVLPLLDPNSPEYTQLGQEYLAGVRSGGGGGGDLDLGALLRAYPALSRVAGATGATGGEMAPGRGVMAPEAVMPPVGAPQPGTPSGSEPGFPNQAIGPEGDVLPLGPQEVRGGGGVVTGAPGSPAPASPFRNPVAERARDDAYDAALQSWRKLQEQERDPARKLAAAKAVSALLDGRSRRIPIEQVMVGGQPIGPAGIGTLPNPSVDPKRRMLAEKQVSGQLTSLQKLVLDLPADDPLRTTILGLVETAPGSGSYDSDAGLDAADQWYNRALAATYTAQGRLGRKDESTEAELDSRKLKELIKELAGASTPALLEQLPELLVEENRLFGKHKSALRFPPRLRVEQESIERLKALKSVGTPEALAEAADLAQEIASRVSAGIDPRREQQQFQTALRMIGESDTQKANDPEHVRDVFKGLGIEHLLRNFSDDSLRFGGKRLERHYESLLGKLPAIAKLTPEGQSIFLKELSGAAATLGKKIALPAALALQMSPEAKQRLALARERFDFQVANSNERMDLARLNYELSRAKFAHDLRQEKAGKPAAPGGITPQQRAQQTQLRRDADHAFQTFNQFVQRNAGNDGPLKAYAPDEPAPANQPSLLDKTFGRKAAEHPHAKLWNKANELYRKYEAAEQTAREFTDSYLTAPASAQPGPDNTDLLPGKLPPRPAQPAKKGGSPSGVAGDARARYKSTLQQNGVSGDRLVQMMRTYDARH